MITDRIGLHSALLPSLIVVIVDFILHRLHEKLKEEDEAAKYFSRYAEQSEAAGVCAGLTVFPWSIFVKLPGDNIDDH